MGLHELSAIADPEAPGQPLPPVVDGKAPSAVLVPVYDTPDGPEMIFTRRAWHLRSHAGQISFPGGRAEDGDRDLVHTALRESEEEIGLSPDSVTVLGELERLTTVASPANIVPILGVLPERPSQLVASADEVDDILHVSIAELLRPEIYREEIWFRNMDPAWPDGIPITFFELEGDTLWGATARIVRTLLEQVTIARS